MKKLILLTVFVFFTLSCVKKPEVNPQVIEAKKAPLEKVEKEEGADDLSNESLISEPEVKREFTIEERGSINSYKKLDSKPIIPGTKQVKDNSAKQKDFPLLNLEDANLWEVIKIISDYKNWNYVIDPTVPDKGINIRMHKQMTDSNMENILHILLSIYNVSMVERDGVVYFTPVKGSVEHKASSPVLYGNAVSKQLSGEGWITQIIPLKFASTKDVSGIIKDFMSPGSSYYPDDISSTIVVIDRAPYIRRILDIVNLLDVNVFKNKKMSLIKFENADASKVVESLALVFKAYPGLDVTKYYLVALKEMNALLCITSVQEVIDEVNFWAEKYEKESEVGETQVFVYRVEHSASEDLSAIIKELYASDHKTSQGKDGQTIQKPVLQGDLKIITDKTNNALIFKCTKRDYNIIEKTLKQLDQPKKQVLIEVQILDVTLGDQFSFGFNYLLEKRVDGDFVHDDENHTQFNGLNDWSGNMLQDNSPAFSSLYDILVPWTRIKAALSMDEVKSRTNVLSTPRVLVLDNEKASIDVGTQISISTGQSSYPTTTGTTGSTPYTQTQYQYLKTGIKLDVTPTINSNGMVRLEVSQTYSTPGEVGASGNPNINDRSVNTIVNVPSGQSLLLGGLIQETNINSNSSVPFLSKIPIIRNFFKSKSDKNSKAELVIIITPKVLFNPNDGAEITAEFKKEIESFKSEIYGELNK